MRALALFSAAREAGLTAHLGLVTYHKSGEFEDTGYQDGRYQREDEDEDPGDGTMGEIYEEYITIGHWRDGRDREISLGGYTIDEDRLIAREALGTGEPDEKESEGFTGNAGCTMDYWYRRAAIALWADADVEEILCSYDFTGACRTLENMVSGTKKRSGVRIQRLSKAIVSRLPGHLSDAGSFRHHQTPHESPLTLTLAALAGAAERELVDELLPQIPDDAWSSCDAATWEKLHHAFGVEVFSALYQRLLSNDPEECRPVLFIILDALLARKAGAPLARKIAIRLARLEPAPPARAAWETKIGPQAPGDRAEVRILLTASRLLADATDRAAVMDFVKADRSLDVARQVLAPVLLETSALAAAGSPGTEALAFSAKALADEISQPVKPSADWVRPCPQPSPPTGRIRMGMSRESKTRLDATLRELAVFMAGGEAKSHEFRHPQEVRNRLANVISEHALDLDRTTLRSGRPHALVCTKNDNSYHCRLDRRAEDEKLLANLAKL